MSFKIFLDDWRDPAATISYMMKRMENAEIYTQGWVVVRSYKEFTEALDFMASVVTHISFDYDLDMTDKKEKTGADCARYAKKAFSNRRRPEILIHSTNEAGIKRIKKIFE